MSMFTLAIFCLTTSNLPWFMDLAFQVPIQYCSLQHQTLLSLPYTVTTEHWFHFDPAFSFFLENCPLLFSSNILEGPGGLIFLVSYIFAFSYCSWCSHSNNTGVVCHSLLHWTTFCQNSPLWPVHLGWPCATMLIVSLYYGSSFATPRLMIHEEEIQIGGCQSWQVGGWNEWRGSKGTYFQL